MTKRFVSERSIIYLSVHRDRAIAGASREAEQSHAKDRKVRSMYPPLSLMQWELLLENLLESHNPGNCWTPDEYADTLYELHQNLSNVRDIISNAREFLGPLIPDTPE